MSPFGEQKSDYNTITPGWSKVGVSDTHGSPMRNVAETTKNYTRGSAGSSNSNEILDTSDKGS